MARRGGSPGEGAAPGAGQGQDRRRAILEAAFSLFAARGFHGTTTKAIAHEAGVSEGLIFHHFDSKVSILVALLEDILAATRESVVAVSPGRQAGRDAGGAELAGVDIEELLKRGFDTIEHAARKGRFRDTIRLFLNSMMAVPEKEKQLLVRRIHDTLWSPMTSTLSPYVKGARVDPYVFFRMVQGMFMGYILFQEVLGWKQFVPLDAAAYRDAAARALAGLLQPERRSTGSSRRRSHS